MCGIVGFWEKPGRAEAELFDLSTQMALRIQHRGPDDKGCWVDVQSGLAMAHRRLSIHDLSQEGHQPMLSHSGRYVLTFNGEIYNFLDLRKEMTLKGREFRGQSDTEVLLHCIEEWGMSASLKRVTGMFAFALFDRKTKKLFLARDRLGEKPLYVGRLGPTFFFGSELESFRSHPDWKPRVDRHALNLFLRLQYVPHPFSIYENIKKLSPGSWIELSSPFDNETQEIYWSAEDGLSRDDRQKTLESYGVTDHSSDVAVVKVLEGLLSDSIKRQMISDVPLGAFLSGGIDSSTIVTLMQKQSSKPIQTFSIGFEEKGFNEAPYASAVAQHLGTQHTELILSSETARAVIPNLAKIYSEPFADSSQIPTFLVSQLARKKVTVSLSGDAGDELFGGYSRHLWTKKMEKLRTQIPQFMLSALGGLLGKVPEVMYDKFFGCLPALQSLSYSQPGARIHKLSRMLKSEDNQKLYRELTEVWPAHQSLVSSVSSDVQTLHKNLHLDHVSAMMLWDLQSYLIDDVLVKLDRASMAVGLESRVPFLDKDIVEFALALPLHYKIRGSETKWILRQILYQNIPRRLMERPKMGFSVPIDQWLRGPLKEWAGDLLASTRLQKEAYLNEKIVSKAWADHLSEKKDCSEALWPVLMFEAWFDSQGHS